MTKIQIIADGPCDLSLSYFQENDLLFIPHGVHIGDNHYSDRVDIQPKELYDQMRNGAAPTTSQGPTDKILEAFYQIAKEGSHGIYLVFSTGLSGTYNGASVAKQQVLEEYPDFKMELFDSKAASIGLGLMVQACVKVWKNGGTVEEILQTAKFYRDHLEHVFTVDDLTYLARGGRLKKSAALIGGMLNMKPIITIEDGNLIAFDKVRGKKKALATIIDVMRTRGDRLSEQTVALPHADNLEGAKELQAEIEAAFGVKHFIYNEVGGAIGSHAGPGTIGAIFLNKLPE